jgi:hypothetical protein
MRPAGHEAQEIFPFMDRGDDRHVRQVGAAEPGMVRHHHVAGRERHDLAQPAHAQAQRSEVHGDVRRVDHQLPGRIEEGAREVEPLLDVRGDGRAPQPLPHLPRHRGEAMGEQLQLDRFGSLQKAPVSATLASRPLGFL